jgi:hypothetical protein
VVQRQIHYPLTLRADDSLLRGDEQAERQMAQEEWMAQERQMAQEEWMQRELKPPTEHLPKVHSVLLFQPVQAQHEAWDC